MRLSAFSHLDAYNYDEGAYIEIRQCKYLNNIVEQDHRFIKKKVWPTLGFKSFRTAAATIAGIELMLRQFTFFATEPIRLTPMTK